MRERAPSPASSSIASGKLPKKPSASAGPNRKSTVSSSGSPLVSTAIVSPARPAKTNPNTWFGSLKATVAPPWRQSRGSSTRMSAKSSAVRNWGSSDVAPSLARSFEPTLQAPHKMARTAARSPPPHRTGPPGRVEPMFDSLTRQRRMQFPPPGTVGAVAREPDRLPNSPRIADARSPLPEKNSRAAGFARPRHPPHEPPYCRGSRARPHLSPAARTRARRPTPAAGAA